MPRILVPVDGSDCSIAAVREAIRLLKQAEGGEIHLLNVQAPVFDAVNLGSLPADKIEAYYTQAGALALEEAERLAREAGVSHATHRAIGPIVETILEKRRTLGCESIVMGTHGRGKVAEFFLGSIAQRVVALADVPVTLVKTGGGLDVKGRLGAT